MDVAGGCTHRSIRIQLRLRVEKQRAAPICHLTTPIPIRWLLSLEATASIESCYGARLELVHAVPLGVAKW